MGQLIATWRAGASNLIFDVLNAGDDEHERADDGEG